MGMRSTASLLAGIVVGLAIALGVVVVLTGDSDSPDAPEATAGTASTTSTTVVDRGGDVLVFLEPDVTEQQRSDIEGALEAIPEVAGVEYWDQAAGLAEALRLFADNPVMLAKLESNPDLVPASYRVSLMRRDVPSAVATITAVDGRPGVLDVRAMNGLSRAPVDPVDPGGLSI